MGRRDGEAWSNKNKRRRGHCRLPPVPDETGLALLTEAMRADIRAVNGERELRRHQHGNEEQGPHAQQLHSDGIYNTEGADRQLGGRILYESRAAPAHAAAVSLAVPHD